MKDTDNRPVVLRLIEEMGRDYMLAEDWQGAKVYESDEPELFVYWPFAGTA